MNGFTVHNEGQPYPQNMPTKWQRVKISVKQNSYKTGAILAIIGGLIVGRIAYNKGYFGKLKQYWQDFKSKYFGAKKDVTSDKQDQNKKNVAKELTMQSTEHRHSHAQTCDKHCRKKCSKRCKNRK